MTTTITCLGPPSQLDLKRSWKQAYLNKEEDDQPWPSSAVQWRRLPEPRGKGHQPSTQQTLDFSHLERSFSLHHQDAEPSLVREQTMESLLPTQLPEFDFDMQSVLDLEDLETVAMTDKSDKPLSYSVLSAVLQISDIRNVVTRAGKQTEVVILTLGDATKSSFEIAAWGHHAQFVQKFFQRLDVVLISDFCLSRYHGVLGGTSRANRSKFLLLYRTNRQSRYDDQFRPLLMNDLQSERVKSVRDWVLRWIPSETQPTDSQVSE